jgi:alkane 1-monooxygenase
MAIARYWAPFGFLALVPLGLWLGGAWTFALALTLPVALTGLDWLLGEGGCAPPPPGAYRLLPWLYIPLQAVAIVWAAAVVQQPHTTLVEALGLTASSAAAAGVFGFLAAHEMIHSRSKAEQALGLFMLAFLLDMQFAIAHVQGHHRRAATPDDPATARRGESAYAFVVRSVAGQAREAWAFETARLARAGRSPVGLGNRMVQFGIGEAAVVLLIAAIGWRALAFFLAQAMISIVLLELFNYVAHYGLFRRRGPDGRLEPLSPRHSWNSGRRMNNASLFNMGRHSDHHRFSTRPYHALEPLAGGAELPCGYAGVLLLALVPPLWRKVMDPRVDAAMAGDVVAPTAALMVRLDSRNGLPQVPPRLSRERPGLASGAEGATAPETLRQKDRASR